MSLCQTMSIKYHFSNSICHEHFSKSLSLCQTMYHKITHHFLPQEGQLRVKVRRLAAIMWRLDTSNKENIKKTKMKKESSQLLTRETRQLRIY